MRVVEKTDRIHVRTDSHQWTVMKKPRQERAICSISDVRHKSGEKLVQDSGNFSINDPKSGGLFSFGFIVAKPGIKHPEFQPDEFWNWAWEITTKRTQSPGFGVLSSEVTARDFKDRDSKLFAQQTLGIFDVPLCNVFWTYLFGQDDVYTTVEIHLLPQTGLWVKEPKIVCNGLQGYKRVTVFNITGAMVEKPFVLTKLPTPKRRTYQINHPARYRVCFQNENHKVDFTNNHGTDMWYEKANHAQPMYDNAGPLTVGKGKYCMPAGDLLDQWEVPYWPDEQISGLCFHVWEGGYGAPDCWNCFRPWPTKLEKYIVKLEARFNAQGNTHR